MLDQDAIKKEQESGQNQWLNSLFLGGHYLQTLLSTLQRLSHRTELTNVSAPTRKLPRTPLFQPGEGLFSTQLTEPSILRKRKNREPIRLTGPPALLTRTTFQRQGTSAVQPRNRSQSPINKSAESRNRSTMNQTTRQVIYQPLLSCGASGLPKLKLTEFSGDPLEWPEW